MTDHMQRLRDANPISDTAVLNADTRAEGQRLLAAAIATPIDDKRWGMPWLRRPIVAPLAGAMAVAAATAVALVSGIGSGDVQPPQSRAAIALNQAADAAESEGTSGTDIAADQYLYVRERNAYMSTFADLKPGPFSTLERRTRETWTSRAGNGEFVERIGKPVFLGSRDRTRWEGAGRPQIDLSGAESGDAFEGVLLFAGEEVTYDELAAKPTNGHAMYKELKRAAGNAGNSPDEEVFVSVGDLLRTSPVPSRIRAALYRALAYVKGIRFAGAVRDPEGRSGLAVELTTSYGTRSQLVFDPDTSQLLAEQEVLVKTNDYVDAKPGTVISYRVVIEAGPVDRLGKRPPR